MGLEANGLTPIAPGQGARISGVSVLLVLSSSMFHVEHSRNGGVDRPGGPDSGFGDESVKERFRGWADVVAAFGMPLDAEDEVGDGSFVGLATLNRFYDTILRAACGDAEAVARNTDGLMMAGVDRQAEEAALFGSFFWGEDGSEEGFRHDGGGVGDGDAAASRMVDREDAQVLQECAATPDIQRLDAEADAKDRFVEVVGVLKEEFVNIFARVVRSGALGDGVLAIFVWVDIGWAAREKDGPAGVNEVGDFGGGGFERDFDGFAAAALNS
jgi:hypothetical protein